MSRERPVTAELMALAMTLVASMPFAASEESSAAARFAPTSSSAVAMGSAGSAENALQTVSLRSPGGDLDDLPRLPRGPVTADPQERDQFQPIVLTEELAVDPFTLAAVTWRGEADIAAWVRTRSAGGWSQWYELPSGDDHAPDDESAEATGTRQGTGPLLVPRSDIVQVRVDSSRRVMPTDLRLDLIDPLVTAEESTGQLAAARVTSVGRPAIYTRAQWGADESLRDQAPTYGAVSGTFVHHTVNSNDYSRSEIPGIIRAIYLYHVQSRGWNDIGYNFLIDRFGQIWEGRYGGVDRAVVGAHTAGYNDDAFGVSAIGTYTDTAPSASVLSAYQQLIAWKFSIHGVDPRTAVNYDGELWPAISGHRDAATTACPGDALYARLDTIRSGVVAAMYDWRRDPGLGVAVFGRRASDASLWRYPAAGNGFFGSPAQVGSGWSVMRQMLRPGDVTGDHIPDVLGLRRADHTLWLYRGVGDGSLRDGAVISTGWQVMDLLIEVGDWDGDGPEDVMARRQSDGTLWLYRGDDRGAFHQSHRVGVGWNTMDLIIGAGDFDRSGGPDLVARRRSDGTLWLYPGSGNGGFGARRQIGVHWSGMTALLVPGDFDGDGLRDLLARSSAGYMFLYEGQERGELNGARLVGSSWNIFNALF